MKKCMWPAKAEPARNAITVTGSRLHPAQTLVEALYRYRSEQRDANIYHQGKRGPMFPAPTDEELKSSTSNSGCITAPNIASLLS